MRCEFCERISYIFNLTCEGCKTRLVQLESCKYLRKVLVETYSEKYGEFQNWKEGKTCDCDKVCKRKAAIRKTNEQQINSKGKATPRKR